MDGREGTSLRFILTLHHRSSRDRCALLLHPDHERLEALSLRYWLEIVLAPVLSVGIAGFLFPSAALAVLGWFTWTLIEYSVHKLYLHDLSAPLHKQHHQHPQAKIYTFQYAFWAGAFICFLVSPAFTAGLLASYGFYLFVHHAAHHSRGLLPKSLLDHHDGHHKLCNYNYGVSTTMWDQLFRTKR
jgi:hypothetical protein